MIGIKQGPDEYDKEVIRSMSIFQDFVLAYFAGAITIEAFRSGFEEALRKHYYELMILGLGGEEPLPGQLDFLGSRIGQELIYLDGFVNDLPKMTIERAKWRAGLYAFARSTYIGFTIPLEIVSLMPVLPGDDCLGGDLCHCSLNVEVGDDGTHYVYWVLDPASESCEVCIAHSAESPFVFSAEEVANAS